ncbi:MAG TPA: extracellular solute-binding protein [Cellvibrionaceae bacterium]|nr:extracellular solute-binding protein [Cellvibrionaceae bacterium]HMW71626.1 extracellular solute-binding protein [Cellvibrionaceae bacterium]HMY38602.1 extracellular solute-binding protein [Marinagarivorans sp.]HNG60455.1 extracellular solute-binding protein [Cellvibrionaceae bacterium]
MNTRRLLYPLVALCCSFMIALATQAADQTAKDAPSSPKTKITHALTLMGEPKYPANFERFEYTSAKAQKGGSVKLAGYGTFDSLNAFITKGTPDVYLGLLYDTLTQQSLDEPFTEYGLVAEKIELAEDRSFVIFHINPKAKFNDGKAITAEDVVFTFNTLITKGAPQYATLYAEVKSVQALDAARVKFDFKTTTNRELPLIVGQLPVLPKHFWQNKDFAVASLDIPLGSGPYKIKKVDAGRSLVYERVANYWAADLPINRGMYNFDQLTLDYYRDDTVIVEALKARQLDYRWERVAKTWATAYDTPAVKSGLLKKQLIDDKTPTGMSALIFNLRKPLFDNIYLRQAFNYAFDFEWTNKTVFFDSYERIQSYFSNSELASAGLPSGRELEILTKYRDKLPEAVFAQPFANPKTDGSGNNRDNMLKAQALLKQGGFELKEGKLIDPKTQKPLVLELVTHDALFERIANPWIQNLKRLGIEVNLRVVDVSQYINRVNSFNFDLTVVPYSQGLNPGNEQREYWGSAAASIEGSSNYAGIKNPIIDELVDLVIRAPDRPELIAATRALDRVLLNQHYMVSLYTYTKHRLVYWDKFGQPEVAPAYDNYYRAGFMTRWIDKDKEAKLNASKP